MKLIYCNQRMWQNEAACCFPLHLIKLHECHLSYQPSFRPASGKVPASRQKQSNPPHSTDPRVIPVGLSLPSTPPRLLYEMLDDFLSNDCDAVKSEEFGFSRGVAPIASERTADSEGVDERGA